MPRYSLRDLAIIFTLTAVYFGAGKLGLSLAFLHKSASPVWPPTGIALAVFLILGYRLWPAILLGAFLVNITTEGTAATSLGIAVGNTLEGVLGCYLVQKYANGRNAFDRAQDVFRFALFAAPISTTVSATFGVTSLTLGGYADWNAYGAIWLTWWLGDLVGALVVAPFVLLWARDDRRWTQPRLIEAAAVTVCLLLIGQLVFGGLLPAGFNNYPLEFLCFPFLIWAAFRFGPSEAAATIVVLSGISIWGTLRGYGPFVGKTPNESLLLLQAFLGVASVMTLAVSAVVAERRRAEQEVMRLNLDLELRVAERTADLARSNAEMEAFTTSVSHDLRAPVRHMREFSDILLQESADSLDAGARQYLRSIHHGAVQMGRLIDDLLNLSRVGRLPLARERVDLRRLVEEVLDELSDQAGGRNVEWRIGQLAPCDCDPGLMKLVFDNLLSNALKFTRPRENAVIEAGETVAGGGPALFVRDNGVGFEMSDASRLFGVFQRLRNAADFEGTGVGLATVQRIIHKHGGRIWAEGEPDRGATFYFTLGRPP